MYIVGGEWSDDRATNIHKVPLTDEKKWESLFVKEACSLTATFILINRIKEAIKKNEKYTNLAVLAVQSCAMCR